LHFVRAFPLAVVPMSAFQKAKPAFLVHPLGREVADEPGDGQIVRDAALNDRLMTAFNSDDRVASSMA
jgi:hypothetical protein